jgi:extradiol dioxygenase family protein
VTCPKIAEQEKNYKENAIEETGWKKKKIGNVVNTEDWFRMSKKMVSYQMQRIERMQNKKKPGRFRSQEVKIYQEM